MLTQLKDWDTQLLLFLNQFHTDWLDPVIYVVTKTEFWIPLYAFFIYLIFKTYKKDGWYVLAGIVVTVVLADQFTTSFMKPFFHRLRPSNEPSLEGILHLVKDFNGNYYHGGLYGFASGHAANTTGVALLVFLVLRKTYRWSWLIFLWAAIMSYTRIYLGVHYPGDIIVGAVVGLLCGYAGYQFHLWLKARVKKKWG